MQPVNLWELLTAEMRSRPKGDAFLRMAAKGSALAGQELTLSVSEDGWKVSIITCYGTQETVLTVPSNGDAPTVKVTEGGYY